MVRVWEETVTLMSRLRKGYHIIWSISYWYWSNFILHKIYQRYLRQLKGSSWSSLHDSGCPCGKQVEPTPKQKKCMTSFSDSAVIRLVCRPGGGKRPEPWGDATLNLSRCQCYDIWPLSLTNCDSKISEFQRVPAPLAGKPTLPPDSNRLATKC